MPEPKYDAHLAAAIEALVKRGDLDEGAPAYGVALAAIAVGYDRLTRPQKGLFDRILTPALAKLAASGTEGPASSGQTSDHAEPNPWKSIREAPGDRDVQLGLNDQNGVSPLAFACRRVGRTWVQSATGKRLSLRPTHWREWSPG